MINCVAGTGACSLFSFTVNRIVNSVPLFLFNSSSPSDIPQMYTDVELICRFAQNYPSNGELIFKLLPYEKIDGIFVYICGKSAPSNWSTRVVTS
jgi:hypothetical protein